MPSYAHLDADLLCPHCDAVISTLVAFQWGYCPARIPIPEEFYHIGDAIRWRECRQGLVPAWTYFSDEFQQAANIGDPAVQNLLVQDSQFAWDTLALPQCLACKHHFGGAMIAIQNGIIQRAWLYLPDDFDRNVDHYLISVDGRYVPKPEWNDHPMDSQSDCGRSRLFATVATICSIENRFAFEQ